MLGGLAHALEGVEEIEVARGVAARHQGQCHEHHAATTPHAAFDDVAGDAMLHDMIDGAQQTRSALQAGHGERIHARDDLAIGVGQVG